VPAENPPQGNSDQSSVQESDGETTAARREYEDHRLSNAERQDTVSDEPDVLLDVPVLKVEEIDLTVEGLRAHVSVLAELADFVKLSVGADVALDKVELTIKGVEAQALLKVRLEQVRAILDKALTTIGENPEILQSLVQTVDRTVGEVGDTAREAVGEGGAVSRLTEDVGEAAGQAVGQVGQTANQAVGQVTEQAGSVLEETVNEAGQTVQRVTDGSGSVVERTLNESGEVLDEDLVGEASEADSEGEQSE
jgi:NTP pyrophosphatase (non-canonical NTP hydrolase)